MIDHRPSWPIPDGLADDQRARTDLALEHIDRVAFDDVRAVSHLDLGAQRRPPDDGTFTPDVLGPRTHYINKLPPPGETEFPVGTVIVEARENQDMKIFAAVKRGAGFNAGGAAGWEWFELEEQPVVIVWRGVGSPAGDVYGGDPNGGCNSCHAACGARNDFICSLKLQLAAF